MRTWVLLLAVAAVAAADEPAPWVAAAAGRPVLVLACGTPPDTPPPHPTVYGALAGYDADRAAVEKDCLRVYRKGHAFSSGTIRFTLPDSLAPGRYELWTRFALGGIGTQTFTVSAGPDAAGLRSRTVFSQRNAVSWQAGWLPGSPLTLYPADRLLEVTVAGKQSDCKTLEALALVQQGPLPPGMTAENGAWRAAVESLQAAEPTWRIRILEGPNATAADPFHQFLATAPAAFRDVCSATIVSGEDTAQLLWMDAHWAVRGVLAAPATAAQVADFVAAVTAVGPAPGPFPPRGGVAANPAEPLVDGVPGQWLIVSGWAGPTGLALWGIDAEARTRPNPGAPCAASAFDRRVPTAWAAAAPTPAGPVVLEAESRGYTWPKGAAYAHLYLDVPADRRVLLHLHHTGVATQGWLDGQPLAFVPDPAPPADFAAVDALLPATTAAGVGTTDQGGEVAVRQRRQVPPQVTALALTAGRHRLLLKPITQQPRGETVAFMARFTGADGIRTSLSDLDADLAIQQTARQLTQRVTVNAPANLPHAGDPLTLRYDLRFAGDDHPVIPFTARLDLRVVDYDGAEVARRETTAQFPGVVDFDLGPAPERGYYAVLPTLWALDGRFILAGPPDGFSVIGGSASQFARRDRKEMAVTYYFMGSGDQAVYRTAFPWMTRMGIYRDIGSSPGFPEDLACAAAGCGITLTMDFWDIHNSYTQEQRQELATRAAAFTGDFKSFNEIDIRPDVRRTPALWVERCRGEYTAVHTARPDGVYVGGSLVRPASDDWFTDCLRLGLDRYIDAWDVHCYPQHPPTLEGSMSNGPAETDLGVQACYARLGRANDKPFWIGETGARASHGLDARRWQAATVAKMVACALSRDDFRYIGFLWPWSPAHTGTHVGPRAGVSDIPTAHMPAEAAYYTASALIDGFSYTRLELGPTIQAARFGDTIMLWTTAAARPVDVPRDAAQPWVMVDVVGRVRPLPPGAPVPVTASPLYLLPQAAYDRLTAE